MPLPGTDCTMAQKEDGTKGTEAISWVLHGKRFTPHTLSIAEEPGSLQPKEFIAHTLLNLI